MTEAIALPSPPRKCDLLLVSGSTILDQRMEGVVYAFDYSYQKVKSTDEAQEQLEGVFVHFIVYDASTIDHKQDVVGYIQVLKYLFPKASVLVLFPKRYDKETLQWIRKSGADFLMSETELLELARFDFFLNQIVGTDYLPVKHGDFKLGSKIEIPLYYSMPANRKYFPIAAAHSVLDESRLDKIRRVGDVYIRRADVDIYTQYLESHQDQSAKGLIRRCRAQFNEFKSAYLKLVNHLTEEAEAASYDEGKKILDECQKLSGNLITSMMSAGSVFEIISQSLYGDFNSVDRGPERAAIVGYFCVMGEIGQSDKAIMAALLADLGMLALPSETLHYFRVHGYSRLNDQMKKSYESHPQYGINFAAQKKIQLDPLVREAILNSHARLDEKGFPVVRPDKISIEAQIVQLVQRLDDECQIQWGKARLSYAKELKRILHDPSSLGYLSPLVLKALKSID